MSRAERTRAEAGSAVVEFLGISILLLIPLFYLVLVLARVQAATYAVEGAARDAARAYVRAADVDEGAQRAGGAVRIALADQGFAEADGQLDVECAQPACLVPGAELSVEVRLEVVLPGVPSSLRNGIPLSIPVSAVHVAVVDPLRAQP